VRTFHGLGPAARLDGGGRRLIAASDAGLTIWELGATVQAPPLLARPSGAVAMAEIDLHFHGLVKAARRALAKRRWPEALRSLEQARRLEGHERDARALVLWERLALHSRRTRLRGAWIERTLRDGARFVRAALVTSSYDDADEPIEQEVRGHRSPVVALAISNDGAFLVSSEEDGAPLLWELGERELPVVTRLEGADDDVRLVWLSPDHRKVFAWYGEAAVRWHLAPDVTWRRELIEDASGISLGAVPAGRSRYLLGARDGWMLWDPASGQIASPTSYFWSVEATAATSDHRGLGIRDTSLVVVDHETGKDIHHTNVCRAMATALSATQDGRLAVVGDVEGRITVFDLSRGERVAETDGHRSAVTTLVVTADGTTAFSAGDDGQLRAWDIEPLHGRWEAQLPCRASAIALRPDAGRLAVGLADGRIQIWRLDWELDSPASSDLDQQSRTLLQALVRGWKAGAERHSSGEADVEELLEDLSWAGLGWLEPERVRDEIERVVSDGGAVPEPAEAEARSSDSMHLPSHGGGAPEPAEAAAPGGEALVVIEIRGPDGSLKHVDMAPGRTLTVGRKSSRNDIALPSGQVSSGTHALLEIREDGVAVHCYHINGVTVGDALLEVNQSAVLPFGGEAFIGDFSLRALRRR
jgi:hypothetical protein